MKWKEKVYLGVVLSVTGLPCWATGPSRPNILFILADDLCYEALGCVNGEVQTPNLDRLADEGVMFSHAYNMGGWDGALCAASRAMFNTGRSLWHNFKLDRAVRSRKWLNPPPEVDTGTTWSQWFSAAGYHTYFAGKWHTILHDAENVFDEVGIIRPGMPNQTKERYERNWEPGCSDWEPWDKSKGGFWQGGQHWSEVLRDEAMAYLRKAPQRSKPFFAYISFNAPHDPKQAPKEYIDRYPLEAIKVPENFLPEYPYAREIQSRNIRGERLAPFPRTEYSIKVNRQEYYALITHMDDQIGAILAELDKTGMRDNTYIIFTADHGLALGHHGMMAKQNMYEHSLCAPLMVSGPGIPKGKRFDERIYIQDIVPTTLDIADIPIPEQVEFKSFLPLLNGGEYHEREAIYAAYKDVQRAVIVEDFKLIYYADIPLYRLFNLKNDPYEMNDLAGNPEYAGKIEELKRVMLREMSRYDDEQLTPRRHYRKEPKPDTTPK
ncbi:DUF4976 domain-containing protein [Verrucomicrobia bacterium S94]|nr:DUF4976 domain-containing protein [Verrucomicrobia bacterium S94]